jgi:RNA polymerase sigma factor (sigma-70 family)
MVSSANVTDILVERCKKKDRQACAQLYDQYSKAMYNICLRMVNDSGHAEDILQESFLQVFTHISGFRGQSTIGAWIKRIVINHCLNHLKKRKTRFLEINEKSESLSDSGSVDEREFSLTVENIREAVRQLPDGYRIVFNLYLMEEHSHKQIAEMLGMSESAVKTQYHRAKQKIREIINHHHVDLSQVI